MRRVLVTDGMGFIGSNFVRYWRERIVVNLDLLTYAGDLRNLDDVEEGRQNKRSWNASAAGSGTAAGCCPAYSNFHRRDVWYASAGGALYEDGAACS